MTEDISRDDVTRLFAPSAGKLVYHRRQTAAIIRMREKKNSRGGYFVVQLLATDYRHSRARETRLSRLIN